MVVVGAFACKSTTRARTSGGQDGRWGRLGLGEGVGAGGAVLEYTVPGGGCGSHACRPPKRRCQCAPHPPLRLPHFTSRAFRIISLHTTAMDALAELLAGGGRSKKPSIDAFLAGVRALGDATPSNRDLDAVRLFEARLTSLSATDHLKSTDETLAHVVRAGSSGGRASVELAFRNAATNAARTSLQPTEFAAAKEALAQAEAFVFMAASGQLDKVRLG